MEADDAEDAVEADDAAPDDAEDSDAEAAFEAEADEDVPELPQAASVSAQTADKTIDAIFFFIINPSFECGHA